MIRLPHMWQAVWNKHTVWLQELYWYHFNFNECWFRQVRLTAYFATTFNFSDCECESVLSALTVSDSFGYSGTSEGDCSNNQSVWLLQFQEGPFWYINYLPVRCPTAHWVWVTLWVLVLLPFSSLFFLKSGDLMSVTPFQYASKCMWCFWLADDDELMLNVLRCHLTY